MSLRTVCLSLLISLILPVAIANSQSALVPVLGYFAGSKLIEEAGEEYSRRLHETKEVGQVFVSDADNKVAARLNQIDQIREKTNNNLLNLIDRSEAAVLKVLQQATLELQNLQRDFFLEIRATIEDVVCKVDLTINDHLSDALGDVGRLLGTNTIQITMPTKNDPNLPSRYYFWKTDRIIFEIQKPFDNTYSEIRDRIEENLKYIAEDEPLHKMNAAFGLIAKLAERATCFSPVNRDAFVREMQKYQSRVRQWENLVKVAVNR